MNNLSLTASELERLLKAFGVATILVFLCFYTYFHLSGSNALAASAKALGPAVSISTFIFAVFCRRAWRWRWVAKLMQKTLVEGVWVGQLRSSFGGAGTGVVVPIVFVIRQTYLTLSVQSFTASQEGESSLEALIHNNRTEATRLAYVFELRRLYAGENKRVSGAGELRVLSGGTHLQGKYWTDTPTHGDLSMRLVSANCVGMSCFEDAVKKWPISKWT